MAERRKGKKRKEEDTIGALPDKPSQEQYSIAKWLKANVPTKKTKFLSHNVEYFTAARAVDHLLNSPWSTGKEPLFTTREGVVEYMDLMLRFKFFHRARKIPVSESELRSKRKKKKDEDSAKKSDEKEKEEETSHAEGDEKQPLVQEKKKRKIRLDMHLQQIFVDSTDAYVWIYDPIPLRYWFFGGLVVVVAIILCLFPLWPSFARLGAYYLTMAAAGFLLLIITLAVARFIIFCAIWLLTLGRHHFWLLPNLTEDVGFFASFWPLYKYEYRNPSAGKDKKKNKKTKHSDEEDNKTSETTEIKPGLKEEVNRPETETVPEGLVTQSDSDSEVGGNTSSSSQKSQFELVNPEEVEIADKTSPNELPVS